MSRLIFVNRFYAPDESATAQLLTDLAEHLANAGERVLVLTSRLDYARGATDWPAQESRNGVDVVRLKTTGFGRAVLKLRALDYVSFYLSAWLAVMRHARAGDRVVVKTDPPLLGVVLSSAIRLRRARLINWLQDVYPEIAERLGVQLPAWAYRCLKNRRNATLKRAALNAVLGERMAHTIAPAPNVSLLPNWSLAPPGGPHDQTLRAGLGIADAFVVGYSGNLGRAHDYQSILAAARALARRRDIQFLIIGGGAGKTALEAAAAAERLPNLHFLPYQPIDRLGASLRAIDLHWVSLNPAMEGLIVPSKLYGILSAGRAVLNLGDADGEVARVLRAHGAGVTLDPNDPHALIATIERLAGDRTELDRYGNAAAAAHAAHFSRKRALERWSQALGALDSGNSKRSNSAR